MRLLSTWRDYLNDDRIRLDLGEGIILDTDRFKRVATGWVDISSNKGPVVSSHNGIRIYREENTVWCIGNNVTFSTTGNHNVVAIPTGYRPAPLSGMNYRHEPAYAETGESIRPTSYFSGNLRILNAQVGVGYTFTVCWPTADPKIK